MFDEISNSVGENSPIEELNLEALSNSIQKTMAYQFLHPNISKTEADLLNKKLEALFKEKRRIKAIYHMIPERRYSLAELREHCQRILEEAEEMVN